MGNCKEQFMLSLSVVIMENSNSHIIQTAVCLLQDMLNSPSDYYQMWNTMPDQSREQIAYNLIHAMSSDTSAHHATEVLSWVSAFQMIEGSNPSNFVTAL